MDYIPMDVLNISFVVEDWLDSDTAEVTIDINASVDNDDSTDLRSEIKESLKKLVDAEWRLVKISRHSDKVGREAWNLTAKARVKEEDTNKLSARTKKLGRVGLQYRVLSVDFTPTMTQVEELNRTMRSKINGLIANELERLNEELPGRDWRVSSVSYGNDGNMFFPQSAKNYRAANNYANTMAVSATMMDDDEAADGAAGMGGFEVSQKVVYTAQVAISSVVEGFTGS